LGAENQSAPHVRGRSARYIGNPPSASMLLGREVHRPTVLQPSLSPNSGCVFPFAWPLWLLPMPLAGLGLAVRPVLYTAVTDESKVVECKTVLCGAKACFKWPRKHRVRQGLNFASLQINDLAQQTVLALLSARSVSSPRLC
jgi:hypothetical protein